jgi:hypothetical protein
MHTYAAAAAAAACSKDEPDSPWRVMVGRGNSANRVRPNQRPTKRNSAGGMQQLLDDWLE